MTRRKRESEYTSRDKVIHIDPKRTKLTQNGSMFKLEVQFDGKTFVTYKSRGKNDKGLSSLVRRDLVHSINSQIRRYLRLKEKHSIWGLGYCSKSREIKPLGEMMENLEKHERL